MTAQQLANDIKNWDCVDAKALRELIIEFKSACKNEEIDDQDILDMSSLPTSDNYPINDHLANYPVWAVDENGLALVGDDAESIAFLAEVK